MLALDTLAEGGGEWLKGVGPESDVVMSSRIRLARNLGDFPFIRRCSDIDRANIEASVCERMKRDPRLAQLEYISVAALEAIDRQFLVERQMISRELADASGARTVALDPQERMSVMINEEDHLRIQVMKSGFDVTATWEQINELDNLIQGQIDYAFSDRFGYLTACPTNVGTGMRVSVLMHLPALVITEQIDKVFRSLARLNLVVRGMYGEGTQAMGDFYQVSNQLTLGKTEEDLVARVAEVVPVVVSYERKAREFLVNENQHDLFDQVSRAFGTLQSAQQISSEETMQLLSRVRMGVNLGLIGGVELPTVNKLFIHTQPAHLQKLARMPLNPNQRNIQRATYLQSHLKPPSGNGEQN